LEIPQRGDYPLDAERRGRKEQNLKEQQEDRRKREMENSFNSKKNALSEEKGNRYSIVTNRV